MPKTNNVKEEEKKDNVSSKIKEKTEESKRKEKLASLLKKAKELESKVEDKKSEKLKTKIEQEEKEDVLVPIEDYLKSSIHLGTKVITPDMKPYVYKRRADGLGVFNTSLLDKKIREAADFLSKYSQDDIIVVCKREAGWRALELFSKITGIRIFTKSYPAGILTNPNLNNFIETELVVVCEPWLDKNALNDAIKIKVPVMSICDTNNYTSKITQVLPGNNKSSKSLGMIFYLLAKLYVKNRKLKVDVPDISNWIDNWENLIPPK